MLCLCWSNEVRNSQHWRTFANMRCICFDHNSAVEGSRRPIKWSNAKHVTYTTDTAKWVFPFSPRNKSAVECFLLFQIVLSIVAGTLWSVSSVCLFTFFNSIHCIRWSSDTSSHILIAEVFGYSILLYSVMLHQPSSYSNGRNVWGVIIIISTIPY